MAQLTRLGHLVAFLLVELTFLALTTNFRAYQLAHPKRELIGIAAVRPFRLRDLVGYGLLMESRRY
jgi:hypothetical protein